jgi:hypothetical protein
LLIGLLAGPLVFHEGKLSAEPIAVRHIEGTIHGFLVLRDTGGKILASGDLSQVVKGNRVVSTLTFRFKDGSIDEETTVFSQRGHFRVLSSRRVQKGPSFPNPTDLSIDSSKGQVTVRYTDDGKEKVETERLDLPPDLANGLLPTLLKNFRAGMAETKLSYVAATPKPRLVKLAIRRQGEETFWTAGAGHKATHYAVKVELGGVTGVVAPLVGKQPEDIHIWILGGKAPAFVRMKGQFYPEGPIWTVELTSPVWQQSRDSGD